VNALINLLSIYLSIYGFTALYTVDRTFWTRDQPVARPLPTQDNTNTK
jgi:hypothetical protein